MPDVVAGQWLGEWELGERLGSGGFAVVHRARRGETLAAVKVLTDPRLADRLRSNPASLSLQHEHAVRTLAVHLDHDPPFLVLELLGGGSLRERLGEGLESRRAAEWVAQVASALDHAHDAGVLHLDVKPENVLLDEQGRARLVDFGSVSGEGSELRQSLLLSQELGVAATPDYAAPEVRYADGVVDRRADVYSLAVLAFELLTGRLPLGLDRPSELVPGLPAAVDAVFAEALARDPKRRTLSAGAFAHALSSALGRRGVPAAEPPGPDAPPGRGREAAPSLGPDAPPPPRRRRKAPWVLAAGLCLALGAAAWAALGGAPPEVRAAHPRVAALLDRATGQQRVGLLLPVQDLGAPARGWGRDGAALLDAFPGERPRLPLWLEGGYEQLYERPARDALGRKGHCQLAVHAVLPVHARALADDGALFLVDLASYELRAATPAQDPLAAQVAARVVAHDRRLESRGPLVLLPSLDARLRVTNQRLAWFDAQLTAALTNGLSQTRLRARAGIAPRLRAFDGDARRALSAGATLQCVYDHEAGELRLTARVAGEAAGKEPLLSSTVPLRLDDYDPAEGARAFSVDPLALRLLDHTDPGALLTDALEKARAHLYQREPKRAQQVLETLRARGEPFAQDLEGGLLLGQAHLDQGDVSAALAVFDEALKVHPTEARLRAACARARLDEASRLYRLGKRAWYEDDDEACFAAASALLDRLEALELEGELKEELVALRQRLEREL